MKHLNSVEVGTVLAASVASIYLLKEVSQCVSSSVAHVKGKLEAKKD